MIENILSAYNIKDVIEVVPIHGGLINTTWRIHTSGEDFILQKINDHIFKEPLSIAKNVSMIAGFLKEKDPDYLFVYPIQTNDKMEMVFQEDEGYFRLMPFIPSSHTLTSADDPQQAFEAAKAFGKFNRLLADFSTEKLSIPLPDFHNLSLRLYQFNEALINGNRQRIIDSKELIIKINQFASIEKTYRDLLNNVDFKKRVTHHDTKISNILFDDNNKALCVIDLDTLMPGYFISDVGDMMRTYLSPVSEEEKDLSRIMIRDDFYFAIRDGYLGEMKTELSKTELNHFYYSGKFMTYMQALRFLSDHLNDDVYYGASYPGQNFVRAANQLQLLECLAEKEEWLTQF